MRRGSGRESRCCGRNGGYFWGIWGRRSSDHTTTPPKRPGGLVVGGTELTRWLGVGGARGRVSDRDRLNDFLRFILRERWRHTACTYKIHNQLMHINQHSEKPLHNSHI